MDFYHMFMHLLGYMVETLDCNIVLLIEEDFELVWRMDYIHKNIFFIVFCQFVLQTVPRLIPFFCIQNKYNQAKRDQQQRQCWLLIYFHWCSKFEVSLYETWKFWAFEKTRFLLDYFTLNRFPLAETP